MILRDGTSDGRLVLEFTEDEVLLLANALNEVCNGIDSWEFSTRLGGPREAALALLEQLHEIQPS